MANPILPSPGILPQAAAEAQMTIITPESIEEIKQIHADMIGEVNVRVLSALEACNNEAKNPIIDEIIRCINTGEGMNPNMDMFDIANVMDAAYKRIDPRLSFKSEARALALKYFDPDNAADPMVWITRE